MSHWQIGRARVHRIFDMLQDPVPPELFFGSTASSAAAVSLRADYPQAVDEQGRLLLSYQGFLVETADANVLVDAGVGSGKHRGLPEFDDRESPFLDSLAAVGIGPGDIDAIVCTHLHFDHVGGCTKLVEGRWVPAFPEVPVYIPATELAHWRDQEDDPVHRITWQDSVQPLLDAGLVRAVEELPFVVAAGIRMFGTQGHTPGHVSVGVESDGHGAVITGDMTHHPAQFRFPEWCETHDIDAAASARTRRQQYERLSDSGELLLGTHFMPPSAGVVRRVADHYRLDPVEPMGD